MRVSSNRRPRGGGRPNSGNNRSGSSGGRHGSNSNRRSNSGNRSYDSNGPDGKIRGSASQVYEKYVSLARDSQTSGDPVAAENFFQHAEHYFRIMLANNLVKQEQPSEPASVEENTDETSESDTPSADANQQSAKVKSDVADGNERQDVDRKDDDRQDNDRQDNDRQKNEKPSKVAAEPALVEEADPVTQDQAAPASEDETVSEEKPKTKRRVSRTRGLRRRTNRRSDEAAEKDEPETTE